MRISYIILLLLASTSCWAPKCPVDGCQFVREHRHSDLVTGTFRSRYMVMPRVHFFWDGKGEKLPDAELAPKGTNKKVRKKFPWERW
ncbi:hypothetical protein [Leadbetterella byssophila]|uniref:Lipoprotein n=1 Tax=Leadbetterella byssophila (strain DSM 17132 / JCM 16389 / KACC 11308 / NBRC 106382 / 4M15) TaxID=649349 RepID=E4RU75_LEAB4|nr:hypothetical protein [Leadbetterella byssophila]ADQ16909.1 hypothetical protein Lbys_1189 [Leadbetterella byssophila DSM 17132]